jgi:hypothetical protein
MPEWQWRRRRSRVHRFQSRRLDTALPKASGAEFDRQVRCRFHLTHVQALTALQARIAGPCSIIQKAKSQTLHMEGGE